MKAIPGETLAAAVKAYLADKTSRNREALIWTYDQFCYWRIEDERSQNRGAQNNGFDRELLEAIGALVAALRCKRTVH